MGKFKELIFELKEHAPFTAVAVLAVILLFLFIPTGFKGLNEFKFFHPLHIFFSAIVISAILLKYKSKAWKAFIFGVIGAVIIGNLSDIIMPYLFGILVEENIVFYLELIEKPFWVFGAGVLGSLIGMNYKKVGLSKIAHFGHVLVSTFASLLYFTSFSSISNIFLLFIFVFLAVIIPCCSSDIVYPILVKK